MHAMEYFRIVFPKSSAPYAAASGAAELAETFGRSSMSFAAAISPRQCRG
jgi:hypothetical protein